MQIELPSATSLLRAGIGFDMFDHHSELRIGPNSLRFPHAATGHSITPRDWLDTCHPPGRVHEPGLFAWLLALGSAFEGREVRFFDLGAAFGYFSLIANALFNCAEIVAVEPNAAMAEYVRLLFRANRLANSRIENVLVADHSGEARLVADNFTILPPGKTGGSGHLPQLFKQQTLLDLIDRGGNARDIIKIDVEGWQARFLPPASAALIERGALLLIENDSPAKLAHFGGTNSMIASPFLDAGYRLFWCRHRDSDFVVEEIARPGQQHECNSLSVLLPPELEVR